MVKEKRVAIIQKALFPHGKEREEEKMKKWIGWRITLVSAV